MKKSLVALAALAATTAFAQSSVTLYGIADIWLGSAKGAFNSPASGGPAAGSGPYGATTAGPNPVGQFVLNSGGLSGSRFGLRGAEDLGGGLKANFVIETGFDISAPGATTLGNRQTFVGVSGGFGEVRLGRQYSAYDDARGALDTFGHTSFSSTVAGGAWERVGTHYSFRVNNQIRYSTANLGGFSAAVSYGLGEDKTTTASAGNVIALHGLYANGPITAALAYQSEKVAGAKTLTNLLVGGAYDLGVAKINAEFNAAKDNNGAGTKDSEFAAGVTVPFGATSIGLGFASAKQTGSGVTIEKGTALSLQVVNALSKRTDIYGGLVSSKVKDGGGNSIEKNSLVAVGLRHKF